MKKIIIGKTIIQPEDVADVAFRKKKVEISSESWKKIQKAHDYLKSVIRSGKTIYGVNTGFGVLSNVRIQDSEIEELQYNLLRSHAVGTGALLPSSTVRAMMFLRLLSLCQGYSGVSKSTVQILLDCLNKGVHPLIPEQGSVGASGDLAPLSHLALVLIGEGKAEYQGKIYSGKLALKKAGLNPIRLGPKEGLALINGTQFMTAIGVLNLLEAEYLVEAADLIGAMTTEAIKGTHTAFAPEIHSVRAHPGQIESARNIRSILTPNGKLSSIAKSHENCGKVQDPYSIRCMPQVHGATRDCLAFIRLSLTREINSVTDNPLVLPDQNKILSGGNFHGQIIAICMDLLAIVTAEIASISEQRLEKLVNPAISELPAFLTPNGGLNSGFMIVQVAAASIVSENKTLCHPASVDTIPTSADKEDHVSMGAWAARKAEIVIDNTRRVLAMELLAAAQGIDFLRPLTSSPIIEKNHKKLRKKISFMKKDRFMKSDIDLAEQMLLNKEIHR
jgi:histidine ammonia-lyase